MLDFLPVEIKTIIGISVLIFIGVRGFKLTEYKGDKGNSSKPSDKSK